jgi:hypothetical protein
VPDHVTTSPAVPISPYRDVFGNWCSRIVAAFGPEMMAKVSIDQLRADLDAIAGLADGHQI